MDIIKASAVSEDMLKNGQNHIPLIICSDTPRVYKRLISYGYEKVSLNTLLSQELLQYPKENRSAHIEEALKKVLEPYEYLLIEDFEMLFDPRYRIDVLRLFCEKARHAYIAVKWPGEHTVNKLIYAKPECPDYHEYTCNSYQIRIVQ